jgi:sigma-B regulation protein RsbU (phosphoserine phosphatase)
MVKTTEKAPMSQAQSSAVSSLGPRSWLRAFLILLAIVFAAATIVYSFAWMYYIRFRTPVELGLRFQLVASENSIEVVGVEAGSPAEQAGLRPRDRIIAVNGESVTAADSTVFFRAEVTGKPGETIALTIQRPGQPQPISAQAVFRAAPNSVTGTKAVALQILGSYPLAFLVVGLVVLFMRVENRDAWLLALLFAGFITASNIPNSFAAAPGDLRVFLLAYRAIFLSLIAPLFYWFFAVFPSRSPIDLRWPWLKWALLLIGVSFWFPGMRLGGPQPQAALVRIAGEKAAVNAMLVVIYGTIFLGLVSLGWNALRAPNPDAKRKIRVIVWGALVGITPATVEKLASDFAGYQPPFWLDFSSVGLLILFPIAFAYAVVKHRVLEIPVLLRRSARYVLVKRGFVVLLLLLAVSVNVLFTISFSKLFKVPPTVAMSVGVGFGIMLAWVSAPGVRQATGRIDRAFFRGAYDARMILQDLAQKVRSISSKQELASLLEQHLSLALHPGSLAIYLKSGGDTLEAGDKVPPPLRKLPTRLSGIAELASRGEPWEITPATSQFPLVTALAALHPECLVPALGRSGELMGLLVLGPRLSEEPYSNEDKLLLGSVASQAGVTLESISLAERMAERMEADRRAAQEMEIAREVQRKLLPQECPRLETFDYCGTCIQARAVGGDYYDFVDFGSGHVGFVLADIAGKGISGALLMANLQASLGGQYALAQQDLARLLSAVNRLFYKNTESNHYATMFFGLYDDATRKLRYANCGHNPPLLLRREGAAERLMATATVLGAFENWECSIAEVQLAPGDVLAIYTDGITEAANAAAEEFGEERLLQLLQASRNLPPAQLLEKVLAGVQQFSPGEQGDDLTLIVGRAH